MEMDLTKIAKAEWEPLGPQRITAFRMYLATDGCPAGVYEDVEITDDMIERAAGAWPLPGPPIGDDYDAHMAWRRQCARLVLAAAFAEDRS